MTSSASNPSAPSRNAASGTSAGPKATVGRDATAYQSRPTRSVDRLSKTARLHAYVVAPTSSSPDQVAPASAPSRLCACSGRSSSNCPSEDTGAPALSVSQDTGVSISSVPTVRSPEPSDTAVVTTSVSRRASPCGGEVNTSPGSPASAFSVHGEPASERSISSFVLTPWRVISASSTRSTSAPPADRTRMSEACTGWMPARKASGSRAAASCAGVAAAPATATASTRASCAACWAAARTASTWLTTRVAASRDADMSVVCCADRASFTAEDARTPTTVAAARLDTPTRSATTETTRARTATVDSQVVLLRRPTS